MLLVLSVVACGALAWAAWRRPAASRSLDALLLFGPIWYVITVGPLLVTYFSLRHLYLTSAGVALALAALFDLLTRDRSAAWRAAGTAAAVLLLAGDAAALQRHNRHWNDAARASRALAVEAQRVAQTAPPGSLVLIDVPWRTRHAYVWAWAMPFAMQPPFAAEDLTRRVAFVTHHWAWCCPQPAWLADVRGQVGGWAARPNRVFVVSVSAPDPATWTTSDAEVPGLVPAARALADAATPDDAEARLLDVLAVARQARR